MRTSNCAPAVAGAQAPHWSPDGRKISFQANNGVYTVNADGTQLTHMVAAGPPPFGGALVPLASGPSWSPDGTKLLYSISFLNADALEVTQRWTINANGRQATRLSTPNPPRKLRKLPDLGLVTRLVTRRQADRGRDERWNPRNERQRNRRASRRRAHRPSRPAADPPDPPVVDSSESTGVFRGATGNGGDVAYPNQGTSPRRTINLAS